MVSLSFRVVWMGLCNFIGKGPSSGSHLAEALFVSVFSISIQNISSADNNNSASPLLLLCEMLQELLFLEETPSKG